MTITREHTLTGGLPAFPPPRNGGPAAALASGLVRLSARGFSLISLWTARARQRRALARLDARLLADVGLTPGGAARECAKPFWKA